MRLDNVDRRIANAVQVMAEAFEFACDATTLTDRTLNFREAVDDVLHQTISFSHFVEQCTSEGPLDAGGDVINKYKIGHSLLDIFAPFRGFDPPRKGGPKVHNPFFGPFLQHCKVFTHTDTVDIQVIFFRCSTSKEE